MMKNLLLLSLTTLAVLVPTASALFEPTQLPGGYMEQWSGKSSYAVNLGGGQILHGHVEFAVYDTQAAGNEDIGVPGDRRYLYAYQVFNTGSSATAALSYFGLKDIKPEAIASASDIDTAEAQGGVDATSYYFNMPTKTKAAFEFDGGVLAVGAKSFFLLVGSDYAPVVGNYELIAPTDDDSTAPIPTPEPVTLGLLLGGALIGLRKRK